MPVYAQREFANVSILIGLQFVVIALMIVYPYPHYFGKLLGYLLGVLAFSSLILAAWSPGWIKPTWLRWMEDNYMHVLEEMFDEARAMGRFDWEKRVRTQAELEQWAESVAQKHGWQRLR